MADGESLGAVVGDVPVVFAKVEDSVDCFVCDGVEPTPAPRISSAPTYETLPLGLWRLLPGKPLRPDQGPTHHISSKQQTF